MGRGAWQCLALGGGSLGPGYHAPVGEGCSSWILQDLRFPFCCLVVLVGPTLFCSLLSFPCFPPPQGQTQAVLAAGLVMFHGGPFYFFIFPEKMASRQVIACAETFHHQAVLAPRCVSASLEPGFTASSHPATNRSAAETPLQKGVSDRVLPKGSSEGISPPAQVAS